MVNPNERKWRFLDNYIDRHTKGEIVLNSFSLHPRAPYEGEADKISFTISYIRKDLFSGEGKDTFTLEHSESVIREAENLQKRLSYLGINFLDFRKTHEALRETPNESIYTALVQVA